MMTFEILPRTRPSVARLTVFAGALSVTILVFGGGAAGQGTTASNPAAQTNPASTAPAQPKLHSVEEIRNAFRNAPSAHLKQSPKISHPQSAQALNPAILEELRVQKMGASVGGTAHTMGATGGAGNSQNPAGGSSTPPGGGSNPPGATGNPAGGGSSNPTGGGSNPPGATGGKPAGAGGNPAGAGNNPTGGTSNPPGGGSSKPSFGGNTPPTAVGPAGSRTAMRVATAPPPPMAITPPPSSGSSSTSKLGAATAALLSNAICPPGPGPGVFNVNGKRNGVIFTQDPNGNQYTITGCRFGTAKGDVHLEGGFRAGTIPLMIDSWSDTVITGKLNPALTGEPDQNNVSLVVVPSGSPGLTRLPGFRFYAMRETVTLHTFPQSGVRLAAITASNGQPVPANFRSPFSATVNGQSTGTFTAGVYRGYYNRFSPGVDTWDLSGMAPGFAPVSFQIGYWTFDGCLVGILPAEETLYYDGTWHAQWDPQNSNRIIVDFAELHCHRSQSLMQLDDDYSDSEYALTITLIGPKGVSPY